MWHFLFADYKQKGSFGQIRSYYEIILKAKASTVLHSGKHSRMISCYYGAYFCPDWKLPSYPSYTICWLRGHRGHKAENTGVIFMLILIFILHLTASLLIIILSLDINTERSKYTFHLVPLTFCVPSSLKKRSKERFGFYFWCNQVIPVSW